VNLAAGLDARPYRLPLPSTLRWVEVDLPEILEYKAEALKDERPVCALDRVPLDLSNHDARRGLLADLSRRSTRAVIVAEGLMIYLMPDEVAALARDLTTAPNVQRWILDIVSPGLLEMINKSAGGMLRQAGAPFLFAPAEGPAFFERYGWKVLAVRSLLKTAASLKRLSMFLRLVAMLPDRHESPGSRPWGGVCLLGRDDTSA
jgi:methyltransferase (TIGR00027 family)